MWQVVAENLIPTMFVIITPVLVLIVNKFLQKLAKKWDLEGKLDYESKVDELVLKGIKAVENKSLAAVAKGGERTPGEQKLDQAMKFVNAQLAAMKMPQKAIDELSMLVEAHLFDGATAPNPNVVLAPVKAAKVIVEEKVEPVAPVVETLAATPAA